MFAYLHHGMPLSYLSAQHKISETRLKVIIHNGAVLIAVFWSYHYVRLRSMEEVWENHTSDTIKAAANPPVYTLITDNFEFQIGCPSNLLLNHMAYSAKQGQPGQLKQLLLCYCNNIIALRAPVFGGRATETAPFEDLVRRYKSQLDEIASANQILLIADRGFHLLQYKEAIRWISTFLSGRAKFPSTEVLLNQVILSLFTSARPNLIVTASSLASSCS